MDQVFSSLLIGAGIIVLIVLIFATNHLQRALEAQKNGCKLPAEHHGTDNFTDLSFSSDVLGLYRLHKRYGRTFSMVESGGSPHVTADPKNIHDICTKDKDWGVQQLRLKHMEDFYGRAFLTTDGTMWHHSRRLLAPTFEKSKVQDLSMLSDKVRQLLEEIPKNGQTVDIQSMLSKLFREMSMLSILGIDMSSTDSCFDGPHSAEAFLNAFDITSSGAQSQMMHGYLGRFARTAKYETNCRIAHEFLDHQIEQTIHEKKTHHKKKHHPNNASSHAQSMLHTLVNQTDNRHLIRSQLLQTLAASADSTSELITNAISHLSQHPTLWRSLHASILSRGPAAFTPAALLANKPLKHILLETLRLHPTPTLPRSSRRPSVLPTGGGADGKSSIYAPKGTLIIINLYALHRDPAVFGENVEEFDPGRWDKIRPGQWQFMPFGAGQRVCLGRERVLLEAGYVVGRVVGAFERVEERKGGVDGEDGEDWDGGDGRKE